MTCLCTGVSFNPALAHTGGRNVLIEQGSFEEELIARWMGAHLGFQMTTLLVNEHKKEEGKEVVGVSAVVNAFFQLKPKIVSIQKVQSGGLNEDWINASYNVAKQMQIMLGRLSDDEIMTDKTGKLKASTTNMR